MCTTRLTFRTVPPSATLAFGLLLSGLLLSGVVGSSSAQAEPPAASAASSVAAPLGKPFRIWTVGDSTAQALGEELERETHGKPAYKSSLYFRNSSGLIRRDFHDWPKVVTGLLANPPDAVVISLGANDTQGMFAPDDAQVPVQPGTEGWKVEYTRRMDGFVRLFLDKGVRVYLVGQAHDPARKFAPMLDTVNQALKGVIALRPNVTYIDAAAWLADDQGKYTVTAKNKTGRTVTLRNTDGIHLSGDGGAILADKIMEKIEADRPKP